MKNNTVFETILLLLSAATILVSCSKEKGHVNSKDDMILSETELSIGYQEQSEKITLESKGPWHLTDIAGGEGWLTTDINAGSGPSDVVTLNCTENNEAKGRSAYVRFKLDGIYPEYRTVTVHQSGKPVVKMEAFTSISSSTVGMKATYSYEGDNSIFEKGGFIMIHGGNEEKVYGEMTIVEEKRKNEFTTESQIISGDEYTVKAFLEDQFGNTFISENEEVLKVSFSFGTLACKGIVRTHLEVKDVVLTLPYFLGDGQTYHIEVSCDNPGLSVAPVDVTMSPEGGVIELPVTGMVEETGTATFTMTGLPAFVTTPMNVSIQILMGGSNQILYWETFGEGYASVSKAITLTENVEDNVAISDDIVRFSRKEQPKVVYMKEGSCSIRIEKEADSFVNDPEIGFDWGSSGPVLNLKKQEQYGAFYIHHLDFTGASEMKLEFAVKNPISDKDLELFYSENEGESWTPITWVKVGGDEKPFVIAHSTSTLPGSTDMSLKIVLKSSDGAKKQIDDLRMIGSFK